MPRTARKIGIALAVSLTTLSVDAQTCIGRPAFSGGRFHLGAGTEIGNHATVIGGDIATGSERSLFGRAGVAHESGDYVGDASGITFGGAIGYQFTAGTSGRMQVCPLASGSWGKLDLPGDATFERAQIQLGVTIGMVRESSSSLHLVPFAGLAVAQLSRDLDGADGSATTLATETYFPLTAGAGFHFNKSFVLVADITVPIDLGGGDPFFGLRVVFPLRGRRGN